MSAMMNTSRGPGRPRLDSLPLGMRPLLPEERQSAFASNAAEAKLQQYVEAVREMEGGVAYAIPTNGSTPRALRVNLSRAAKRLDLKLRWAKVPKDAKEVVVELAE